MWCLVRLGKYVPVHDRQARRMAAFSASGKWRHTPGLVAGLRHIGARLAPLRQNTGKALCYHSAHRLPRKNGMLKSLGTIAIVVFLLVPLAALVAGQLSMLSGTRPADIGPKNGLLKAPVASSWNVVMSQATHYPHTDYHVIAPLTFSGDSTAAMARLATVVAAMPGARIIESRPDYLYAEFQTRWLKFVDDVEFLPDPSRHVIDMRSASRLGRKDFGANRKRLDEVRARFGGQVVALK
jgi:uncharacterized protein (DUF1499 family)